MNTHLLNTLILATYFFLLLAVAEILYHVLKIKVEFTRKFVHIITGFLTLLFPVMLGNQWFVLLLCSSFAVILILSKKFNLLQSINAIERKSVGSLSYPISVYGCYLAFYYSNQHYMYYYLPILILAICDPIAALTGKKWPIGEYKVGKERKTLLGSTLFFLSAFAVVMIVSKLLNQPFEVQKTILVAISIALIATMAEAISRKGYDNITIPASVLLSLVIVEQIA